MILTIIYAKVYTLVLIISQIISASSETFYLYGLFAHPKPQTNLHNPNTLMWDFTAILVRMFWLAELYARSLCLGAYSNATRDLGCVTFPPSTDKQPKNETTVAPPTPGKYLMLFV